MYQGGTPEEAEQLLAQLIEHNPDIIWMFSPDWDELKFVDDAYEDLWGRSIRALVDDPVDFLNGVHPDDRATVREHMEQLSGEEAIDFEFRVNAEEDYGRHVWVEGEPIYDDDEFVAVAGFVRDITERKQYERELERKNERLEHFASILSHDLRNPLNVASGRLELVQRECDSDHLVDIEQSLDRIGALIDNLLLLAREGSPTENVQAVDLATVAERCWQNVETADATLLVETERTIRAAPSRLKQLLENLIRNGVEHGGEDVTIRVEDLDDGFSVADDGSGIPAAERDRVFEMGYSTAADGTGLGLSIVTEIADAHGWTVDVTESTDGGARFDVTGVDIER